MLSHLQNLMLNQGAAQYGQEPVSQLEHALQCAALAEKAKAGSALITACLLHDFGHLIHSLGEDCALEGLDDRHEILGVNLLEPFFPPVVTEPIRLHVEAKRFLCATEKGYWDRLSPASQRTLDLQGGIFSPAEAEAFRQLPHAAAAVQLRRWDDLAKVPGQLTPDLDHFWQIVEWEILESIATDLTDPIE